jgi:hypothetical protein
MSFGGASHGDASYGSTTATVQEISVPETQLTQTTEDPRVNPGNSNVQITSPTQLIIDNPNIQLTPGASTVTVNETQLAQTTPAFDIEVGLFIRPDATQINQTTPSPQVQPGVSTVNVSETQLTTTNPEIGLNRRIVFGVVTQLNTENPEPNLEPGIVQVNINETKVTATNPDLQIEPGETKVQVTTPTQLTVFTPDIKVTPGNTDLGIDETVVLQTTPEPSVGLDLQFVSPTNALITNRNRYFDMPDHTFTEGDLGDTLQATLKDEVNPDGVDLTRATEIRLVVKDRKDVKVFDKEMSVVDSGSGEVEYEWSQGDFIEDSGVYRSKIKVFDFTDEPESFPNDGFRTIEVEEEIS